MCLFANAALKHWQCSNFVAALMSLFSEQLKVFVRWMRRNLWVDFYAFVLNRSAEFEQDQRFGKLFTCDVLSTRELGGSKVMKWKTSRLKVLRIFKFSMLTEKLNWRWGKGGSKSLYHGSKNSKLKIVFRWTSYKNSHCSHMTSYYIYYHFSSLVAPRKL